MKTITKAFSRICSYGTNHNNNHKVKKFIFFFIRLCIDKFRGVIIVSDKRRRNVSRPLNPARQEKTMTEQELDVYEQDQDAIRPMGMLVAVFAWLALCAAVVYLAKAIA